MGREAARTLIDRILVPKSLLRVLKLRNTHLCLKQEVVAKSTVLMHLSELDLVSNCIGLETLEVLIKSYFQHSW